LSKEGFVEVKTVVVLGAGTMGHGIAQVLAESGYKVIMRSRKQETIDSGMERMKASLKRVVEKGKKTQADVDKLFAQISTTTDLKAAVSQADVIIETVVEDMALKKEIFKEIDPLLKPETILGTNTSTLSITELASSTGRPDKVIGMHFFNPVPIMKPVEVIRGVMTSEATVATTRELVEKIQKTAIVVKDSPGFVSSRFGISLFLEASEMLEEGLASIKDIDLSARLCYGHRMGPFETCDLVGLDARLNNLKALYDAIGDPRWKPPLLLRQLVAAGFLGQKPGSKGGYYQYFGLTPPQTA
jgi:3-hydroxybutyryl-CoA dehydrogenase